MAEREQELALSYLGEGLQQALMELKGIEAGESQSLIADLLENNTPIQEVYQMLQQLAGERILVDKSPTYASNRDTLLRAKALFSNAKYIQIVRHPYAVIESFTRMRMDKLIGSNNTNPYELAASIWTQSNQNILDFSSSIDRRKYHLVRYEDLVARPRAVMEGVCEFLEIPFQETMLNPYQGDRLTGGIHQQSISVGDPNFLQHQKIDSELGEAWRNIQLPVKLGTLSCQVATHFNYELPQETTTTDVHVHQMQEEFLDVRGLKLCICSWGPEAGPLVLCVHGILEQGAAWLEVAMRLAQKGYRVVAPDLRGHGRSDHVGQGGSYNLLDFLGDLDTIVEKIANQPFTLVGHSLGSVIAAIFASIRPHKVKKLVLVETVLPTEVDDDEAVEQLSTHLDYLAHNPQHQVFPDLATAIERLRLATPALSESLAKKLAERITETCQGGLRWRWAALLRTRAGIGFNGISKSRYFSLLKRIKAPITLIYGNKSNLNRQGDLAQQQTAMPDARKIVVAGGHNLNLEAPSEVAEAIIS